MFLKIIFLFKKTSIKHNHGVNINKNKKLTSKIFKNKKIQNKIQNINMYQNETNIFDYKLNRFLSLKLKLKKKQKQKLNLL